MVLLETFCHKNSNHTFWKSSELLHKKSNEVQLKSPLTDTQSDLTLWPLSNPLPPLFSWGKMIALKYENICLSGRRRRRRRRRWRLVKQQLLCNAVVWGGGNDSEERWREMLKWKEITQSVLYVNFNADSLNAKGRLRAFKSVWRF